MSKPPPDFRQLATETAEALTLLRRRLRAILDRLLPEGYGARSLGRALDIEQTTAWRCWHIAHVADPAQALQAMPGRRAWDGVFRTFEGHGVTRAELAALREAFARIEPLVYGRRADRLVLRSMAAGGLDSTSERAALRASRRATVRGNARLYGISARTVVVAWVLTPGLVRGSVSLGVAGVIDGLKRLRPGLPWPVLQRSKTTKTRKKTAGLTPLGDDPSLPTLIREMSTPDAAGAGLRPGLRHTVETIELADVPPGRNGSLRIAHAEFIANAGTLPEGSPLPTNLVVPILLPIDLLIVEVHLHRDIIRNTEPTASLYGMPVTIERVASLRDAIRMPIEESMRPVAASGLPSRLAALGPARNEAVRRVVTAQRSTTEAYAVHRLALPYPPLFATVAAEFELAGPPKSR